MSSGFSVDPKEYFPSGISIATPAKWMIRPPSLNRSKCVFIGPIFITRWLNYDMRMLPRASGSRFPEGDEEREADTSKATEDIVGWDDADDSLYCY